MMFSNKQLKEMILPLFFEQFLVMLVGLADVFVVSFCGEAAVSGVSLVNSFNTIFIYLFTALASGGAVVVSQYLGRGEPNRASETVSQLVMISALFSTAIMLVVLVFQRPILSSLFSQVETDVMAACLTYLRISALSYPALGIYNAGAALYRSIGKTDTTMYLSAAANLINVTGNLIGVFVLQAGVAGVAWPTFLSRWFSALVITALCFRARNGIAYRRCWIFYWNGGLLRSILRIAVPNGLESGIFQLVKVALSSMVALFGTYQIAANGIAQSFWSMAALVCVTMGPVFITVIGQCMGAGATEQAERYFRQLTRITVFAALGWNALIFALTPLVLTFYQIAPETKQLILLIVFIHNIFNATAFPFADPLGKGLRAAGDVAFTTAISIFTTVGVRLVLSLILAVWLDLGVVGIAWAMVLDWTIRGVIFWLRFRGGRWKTFRVIGSAEAKG